MTQNTNVKKPSELMTERRAQVAAQDAAYAAAFAAIMTRKPGRVRKVEPEQSWIVKHSPSSKKDSTAPEKARKTDWKKAGKAKR
jgi:hypothetical protein